jgi:integrase
VNLRGEILNAIARGTFNYGEYFPDSENARLFGCTTSAALVGDELRAWMKIARLAPSTRLTYERACEGYLYPWFNQVRMRDLSAPMIRAKVLSVRKDDGTPEGIPVTLKTARNILTPLGAMLELAFADGRLEANPMSRVKIERFWPQDQVRSSFEADPFNWQEMAAIFEKCAGGGEGAEADYWRFAFGTGLRPSEQIELRWPLVDLVGLRVRIAAARVTVRKGTEVKGPKTKAGLRDVEMTAGAWGALQRQQARSRLAGEHVWLDPRAGAPWRSERVLGKRWRAILKAAGVRYRNPYQTRHTFASVLLAGGCDPRWVAQQMGHETTEMLERHYGRWIRQGATDRQGLAEFFSHVSPTAAAEATYWRASR